MNYEKIYNDLILRSKLRTLDSYTENHHIVPRCVGGSDTKDNLVALTPEEHYVAHQLLVKIYKNNRALVKAAAMMVPNRPTNKMYGWLKRRFAKVQSLEQQGEGNSQFGTMWILNEELRENKKIPKHSPIPTGWAQGYAPDFDVYFLKKKQKIEKQKKNQETHQKKLNELKEIMYYYRDNDISIRDLSKKFGVGHNVYVSFERYFKDEYQAIVKQKPKNSNKTKGRYD